ncbi:cryptochrome/photolyase family protein [Luteimicrobium subarcticum]|uniref:Deoxyribodipyrimidine photo-lyase type I n=1 Tax=Luteimicrobium subarcticum TaxID=620910 RepID=A0A2M8WJ76_9MICO|nr:deoxyribodipyrimidine photo-lyase [Luteimicrobium subarcticum]PJI90963.1 deoxyribodipyrimidine photo-lyase type I [Luteimicrobium subarcticum]
MTAPDARPTVAWFRRDLRLADNPALVAAVEEAREARGGVVPLFILDPRLERASGAPRAAHLARSVAALSEATGGRLVVRRGAPQDVLAGVVRDVGATSVHVAASFEPFGARRDAAVEAALAETGARLVRTGSPYAVAPGRVLNRAGEPFQVFTPFRDAWLAHGWRAPVARPREIPWADVPPDRTRDGLPEVPVTDADLPAAGERAARDRWHRFLREHLRGYAAERERPDRPGTSRASVALKWGELHPRTLLADLHAAVTDDRTLADDAVRFRTELAWREFHADVLHHHPGAASRSLRQILPEDAWATGAAERDALAAWTAGRTGYPLVDAGMRQLLGEGWVHNRVRMVVASFLVKDLHVRWQRGAEHFMAHLVDGDVPQNQLNWQWVAGTGRDAAPYFRIFNPVKQGKDFDPDGDYVRRWVPELRGIPGTAVHEPWLVGDALPGGYPERVVDHAVERKVALDDFARGRAS